MISRSDRAASASEFNALRTAAGLSGFTNDAAEIALRNTLCGIWLRNREGELVAMARLTGDGGCFTFVTDVAVHPGLQGQGLGTGVMRALIDWADAHLPQNTILTLIADEGAENLYRKFGFEQRTGMIRRVP